MSLLDTLRGVDLSTLDLNGLERRGFLRGVGTGAATATVAGTLATSGLALSSSPAAAQTAPAAPTDADIFNFALNFEYLGAEYYLHGLTGGGLTGTDPLSGTGAPGGFVAAGGPVPFASSAIAQYVQKLAVDELGHVRFIKAVLGTAAIARPTINLATSWTTLALAAGLIQPGQNFNPYTSDVGFLIGAYVLEDVCVTALAGAARLLANPNNVEAAAGLLGVEGSQAGAIRSLLANLGAGQVTNAISNLRATLNGVANDVGTSIPGNSFNFVPVDGNALVFRRTFSQVLAIAYGGGAAANYGFFPGLVNGNIKS